MGRRFAPLARQRKLALLAESLGIEVDETHRALPDALTCARIFCALFPKLCANAASLADALRLLGPRRRPVARRRRPKIPREQRPDLSQLPDDPGVYVFRNEAGQPLYVGKSVAVKSRARAHFCQPGEWTGQAEVVDYIPTNSELGALVLENRLIKQWKPTGQPGAQADRPLGLPRLPARHPLPRARGGRRAGGGPRGEHRAGARAGTACQDLADQLTSLFQLRHCGRKLAIRDHPSLYGQMGRCVSPCLGDLDPNAYRRRLDEALGLFDGAGRARAAAGAARRGDGARRRPSGTTSAPPSCATGASGSRELLSRLGGLVRAVHSGSRAVLAKHPVKPEWDLFWVVGRPRGRLGPARATSCPSSTPRPSGWRPPRNPPVVAPDEVHEVRIVSSWLAGDEAWECELEPGADVAGWVEQVVAA